MAAAIGRSNPDPALRSELGARFTTTLSAGIVNPQALIAARTRSCDSLTAASGMPTMVIPGSPLETTTSTSTGTARTPRIQAVFNTHCRCMAYRPEANAFT